MPPRLLTEQKILDLGDADRELLRDTVKQAALSRDGHQCRARVLVEQHRDELSEDGARSLPSGCRGELDPHEVIPRSAWKFGIYFLSNVLTVCRAHHRWIDAHPRDAHKLTLHGFSWERPK